MNVVDSGRILVVDDEIKLMTALCDMLTAQGYEVVGQTSAHTALQALQEQGFDILLSDLMMPEMDGIALLQAAVARDPYLMGVIMTGQGTIQTAVEAMKVGAFDYVLKPFTLQTLLPVLRRAQEMRRLRMENIQLRETVAIYELGQAMAHSFDNQTIVRKIVEGAMQQVDADEASVMLLQPDSETLCVVAVRGKDREVLLGASVAMGQSIAGWVARNRQPLTLHGAVNDPRFELAHPRDGISAVSLPMLGSSKLVGVLNVNATHCRPFTLGQVKALSIFANLAAVTLENARLYTEVQQAEEKYHNIFEHAITGIFQATPEGRFLTANPALIRLLGYPSAEALRKSISDIGTQLYVDTTQRHEFMCHLAEHGTVSGFETQLWRRDGSVIWVSLTARAVYDDHGGMCYYEGTIEDLTERKRAAAELQQQRDKLYQSEKLATMGQLLAGVAHELNNPLSVVLGQATLLCDLAQSPATTARAQKISQAAERCARIVKNFLALARQRPPERQAVQLNQVVQEAVELLAYQLRVDDIEVCLQLADALPTLWADRHQLHQVVVNLISNAQQAVHDTPGPRRLRLTTLADLELSQVSLEVADTGPGVPAALQQRLFEPFFTTKPPGMGTGLGLSLCHGIVMSHGGTIRLENRSGEGAVFVIDLPITTAPGALPTVSTLETPSTLTGKKILVVDDEPMLAEVLQEMLALDGHQVDIAGHGAMALEKLREQTYDLIMSDLRMPVLSGPDLYRELVQRYPELCRRLIFITGDTLSLQLRAFLEHVAVSTVSKPFAWEEVRRVVQQVLQQGGEEPAGASKTSLTVSSS